MDSFTTSSQMEDIYVGTLPPLHKYSSLLSLLEKYILSQPNSIAVSDANSRISYAELSQKINLISRYIQHPLYESDQCIGLYVESCANLVIGAWGILASGNAYLPLSPDYPEERIQYMIKDSKTKVILTTASLKTSLEAIAPKDVNVLSIEDIFAQPQHAMDAFPMQDVSPSAHNLAYIIYTSGSTGQPKGVMIEHSSIVNQMNYLKHCFGFDSNTIILQKTPMSFDAAQWEILAPAFGGHVVSASPGAYRDPDILIEEVVRHKVTALQCVPTLLEALIDHPGFYDCHSLNQIFSGGEALTTQLARQFFTVKPECELINLYGPTECTINSSSFVVEKHLLENTSGAISIGYPVDNTVYHIMQDGFEVPLGQTGELHIGGVQLARGYLHRPELTLEKFIDNPLSNKHHYPKLYKTGDLAYKDNKGAVHFAGRTDSQVKLRGFRIELDEIRHSVESHSWVKNAAMIIRDDERTGYQNLVCCIELDPKEAALMDQGNHGQHHQSKSNKLQVKAQLSNSGYRNDCDALPTFSLAQKNGAQQRQKAFARKTYRYYEKEDNVTTVDLVQLFDNTPTAQLSRPISDLSRLELGDLMAYFSSFYSEERLLPKYAYASPGALYATQIYVELHNLFDLPSGIYYYHPGNHSLVLISTPTTETHEAFTLHFIGKHSAIEPVYKNNILEVLEMETGHILGLFDKVLPDYGLAITGQQYDSSAKALLHVNQEDFYLGSFSVGESAHKLYSDTIDIYLQTHDNSIDGLPKGHYQYHDGHFQHFSDQTIEKKDVIAINQGVYDRSSFGISLVNHCTESWLQYIQLGRALQILQDNQLNIGLMSSGYSSKSGNDLPSAKKMASILAESGKTLPAFYFCIGGKVSHEQQACQGMREDTVHMRGPAEILRDDLHQRLPSYMIPNQIIVMDKLPLTVNGKVDLKTLKTCEAVTQATSRKPFIEPRKGTEQTLAEFWKSIMKWDSVSAVDDFFECGGNSLTAVALIKRINLAFSVKLPLQTLFEYPTIQQLGALLDSGEVKNTSRMINLHKGDSSNIFCWPGLGGYPMSLRLLAESASSDRSFFGVQAYGINEDETPYDTIRDMAQRDIAELKHIQPTGPYALWGYSFGARVAFEVAYQLEQAGDIVSELNLIAPGSPKLQAENEHQSNKSPTFDNRAFVTILFSVFAQTIQGPMLEACLKESVNEESFVTFINTRFRHLDEDLIRRIVKIVALTYEFEYSYKELQERVINAPITIFKAQGDDYSFLESHHNFSVLPPQFIDLKFDHYQILKEVGMSDLAEKMQAAPCADQHSAQTNIVD